MNSISNNKSLYPPSVDWWITTNCNLNCGFCFGPQHNPYESSKTRLLIAEKICFSKSDYVTLCGGEPLLVPELIDILELFSMKHKNIILNTNGEILSKSRFVYKYINTIGLSIDGYNESTNKQMRGEESNFHNCIDEIWYIKNFCPVKLKIGTVLTKINMPYIFDIAKLINDITPDVWRIYQFSPRGKANINTEKYGLSLHDFEETVDRLLCEYPNIHISASSLKGTEGCFLIDECGFFIKPKGNSYIRYLSCLNENIDDIWVKDHDFSVDISENKSWIDADFHGKII
jgi:MoaA/NifB/PqqE/SkfB family radical SAM enzyme